MNKHLKLIMLLLSQLTATISISSKTTSSSSTIKNLKTITTNSRTSMTTASINNIKNQASNRSTKNQYQKLKWWNHQKQLHR